MNFKINSRPLFTIIFKLKNDNFKTRYFSPLIERVLAGLDEVLFATQICSHLKQPSVAACLSHSVVLAGVAGMETCLVVLGMHWIFYMYIPYLKLQF